MVHVDESTVSGSADRESRLIENVWPFISRGRSHDPSLAFRARATERVAEGSWREVATGEVAARGELEVALAVTGGTAEPLGVPLIADDDSDELVRVPVIADDEPEKTLSLVEIWEELELMIVGEGESACGDVSACLRSSVSRTQSCIRQRVTNRFAGRAPPARCQSVPGPDGTTKATVVVASTARDTRRLKSISEMKEAGVSSDSSGV